MVVVMECVLLIWGYWGAIEYLGRGIRSYTCYGKKVVFAVTADAEKEFGAVIRTYLNAVSRCSAGAYAYDRLLPLSPEILTFRVNDINPSSRSRLIV